MTDYLDHIMQGKGKNEGDNRGTGNIVLDIESLRVKDVKEWKF